MSKTVLWGSNITPRHYKKKKQTHLCDQKLPPECKFYQMCVNTLISSAITHNLIHTLCACLMKSRISSCRCWWTFVAPFSSHRHTECTDQNRSCHSPLFTGSWRSSLRTVGLINGHLSSNCNCPCWKSQHRSRLILLILCSSGWNASYILLTRTIAWMALHCQSDC